MERLEQAFWVPEQRLVYEQNKARCLQLARKEAETVLKAFCDHH